MYRADFPVFKNDAKSEFMKEFNFHIFKFSETVIFKNVFCRHKFLEKKLRSVVCEICKMPVAKGPPNPFMWKLLLLQYYCNIKHSIFWYSLFLPNKCKVNVIASQWYIPWEIHVLSNRVTFDIINLTLSTLVSNY